MGLFSIKVADARNKFSASHFLVLGEGHKCSRLHGHNYTVNLSISGELNDNYFVVDFVEVKEKLQEIVEKFDHFVLVPTESDQIQVSIEEEEVEFKPRLKNSYFRKVTFAYCRSQPLR